MQSNPLQLSLGALLSGLSGAGLSAESLEQGGEGAFLESFEARLRELLGEQGLDLESLDPAAAGALQAQLAQWMPPPQMPSLPLASALQVPAQDSPEATTLARLVSQQIVQLQTSAPAPLSAALGELAAEQILRDRAARPGSDIFEASLLAEGELEAESGREALESATDGLVQASATFSSGRAPEVAGALARPLVFDLRELLQPGGAQRLAEQIQWMARAGEDMAELKLHPPSLGALDVRIAMEGDKTHVQFFSASPVVREVLEAALPRLREALGQENLMLGDASVSDYPSQGRGDGGGQGSGTPSGSGGAWGADEAVRDEEVGPLPDQTLHVLARRLDFFV